MGAARYRGVQPTHEGMGCLRSCGPTQASLAAVEGEAIPGFQPSQAGVSAVNSAIHIVRNRQAGRVLGQADAMNAGAAVYEDTDAQSAESLADSV